MSTPPPSDWQAGCAIKKIVQQDNYGSGIASLAMVAGLEYEAARSLFNRIGLGIKRGQRPAYSNNLSEMSSALAVAGLASASRRWKGWQHFHGLGILKVRGKWRNASIRWHWCVAFQHKEYGFVLFDPHIDLPSFSIMPMNVECAGFELYEPVATWLQVEQRL